MSNTARILKKIIIPVEFRTQAPLRVAAGNDDNVRDILILKNKDSVPFVPGSSVAGVLRSVMSDVVGDDVVNLVFGSAETDLQSMLTVSDMEFDPTTINILHRDGIKLNSFTGTVVSGEKFDYESIDRFAEGRFMLELTVREANEIDCRAENPGQFFADIADKLASVIQSGISIGSLTTKGYGFLKSKDAVKYYVFDFEDDSYALQGWLNYIAKDDVYDLPEVYAHICKGTSSVMPYLVNIEADFALRSTLIVRGQDDIKTSNRPTQLRSRGDAVIPGTSLKGTLNNRALRILTEFAGGNADTAKDFYELFAGTTSEKSRFMVQETYIADSEIGNSPITRTHIDRFTGGAYDNSLFSEQPIYQKDHSKAPVHVSLKISKFAHDENDVIKEKAAVGLMLLLLKDMWLGNLTIGGGHGVGRGSLEGHAAEIRIGDKLYKLEGTEGKITAGDAEELEQYIRCLEDILK